MLAPKCATLTGCVTNPVLGIPHDQLDTVSPHFIEKDTEVRDQLVFSVSRC